MKRATRVSAAVGIALSALGCSRPSAPKERVASAAISANPGGEVPRAAASHAPKEGSRSQVAGTPFFLAAPAGFRPATRFDGLSGPDGLTSIMVTGLPVPPGKVAEMWLPEKLRSQGISLVRKDQVRVSGTLAELALVSQRAAGMELEKWILVFPASDRVFLCVATYPSAQHQMFRSQLREALLSISYEPGANIDKRPLFRVDVTGLKLAHRMSGTEMYTLDGKPEQPSPGAPLLVVGPSIARVEPGDRRAYAEQRLRQTAHTKVGAIAEQAPLLVDDLPGHELVATATDASSGVPMTLYQVMLFEDDQYFLIQGLVGRDQASIYLPQFKRTARSFRRVTPRD